MTKNINRQFQELCKKGKLEEIKQFYFDNPTIDISANDECVFTIACVNKHLKVEKLLLQYKTQNYYIFAKKNKIYNKKFYNKKQQIAKQI